MARPKKNDIHDKLTHEDLMSVLSQYPQLGNKIDVDDDCWSISLKRAIYGANNKISGTGGVVYQGTLYMPLSDFENILNEVVMAPIQNVGVENAE